MVKKNQKNIKSIKTKIAIWIISTFLVICIPFVFGFRENPSTYLGFPFDWLALYPNNGFSFLWIGFILNIIFFYFVIKILIKIYKKIFS